jgi:hypothetical protein
MTQCALKLVSLGLSLGVLAACGGGQRDVVVEGTDNELVMLAGSWDGSYRGADSGRSGPVTFSLRVGQHSAEGEVRMGGTTPLKIEFVHIKAGQIRGTIAPYTDPACKCQVETTFLGQRAGESISGTFETKLGTTGQVQAGSWDVTRTAH